MRTLQLFGLVVSMCFTGGVVIACVAAGDFRLALWPLTVFLVLASLYLWPMGDK